MQQGQHNHQAAARKQTKVSKQSKRISKNSAKPTSHNGPGRPGVKESQKFRQTIKKEKLKQREPSFIQRLFGCCRHRQPRNTNSQVISKNEKASKSEQQEEVQVEPPANESELKVDSSEVFQSMNEGFEDTDTNVVHGVQAKNQKKSKESDGQDYSDVVISIQDPNVQKNAMKLVQMIKKSHQRGLLPVMISSVLLKFAKVSVSEREKASLQILKNVFVSELKKYLSEQEFKCFKQQLEQMSNQASLRPEDKNSNLQEDDPTKAIQDSAGTYSQDPTGSNSRALSIARDRNDGQLFRRIQRNLQQHENLQEASQSEQAASRQRNLHARPQSMMLNRAEGTGAAAQQTQLENGDSTKTKRNQKVHWAEQTESGCLNPCPDSPSLKAMYKNCSKAVIERDRQLRTLHQVLQEENIMQRHIDLQRAISLKYLNKQKSMQKPKPATIQQIDSSSAKGPEASQATIENNHYMFEVDPSMEFKSFICPLCFRFIYKCQITVCGHSYCTKCIDEYLIIKKNCFVCDQTIRTAKGSSLLSCFLIDEVITELISKSSDSDVMAQWETQKCEFTTWQLKKKIDKIDIGEKLDVRDTDYIWCVGEVRMIVESINREPILAIHYEGWNMWYDEFLPINSPRLARLGFYTSRDDIPKYQMKLRDGLSPEGSGSLVNQRGQMQAFIVNRLPQTPWSQQKRSDQGPNHFKNNQKSQRRRLTQQELSGLTEDERRRYENSHLGDSLDDKIECFLSSFQDSDYNNGNREISGLHVAQMNTQRNQGGNTFYQGIGQENADEEYHMQRQMAMNEALDDQIERQNLQTLQQSIVQPVLMRNAIQVLNSVGHGGANIANALVGQQHTHHVHHFHQPTLHQGFAAFQSASQPPSIQTNEPRVAHQQLQQVPNVPTSIQATGASAVGSSASGAPGVHSNSAGRAGGSGNSLSTLIRQIQNIMVSNNRVN